MKILFLHFINKLGKNSGKLSADAVYFYKKDLWNTYNMLNTIYSGRFQHSAISMRDLANPWQPLSDLSRLVWYSSDIWRLGLENSTLKQGSGKVHYKEQ